MSGYPGQNYQGGYPQGGWQQQPQYGQPPPNNQYQQPGQYPPQPAYGQPPPQGQGWGSSAPPNAYGAPPPNQYGAPPPGQYGAPPPGQYGAPPPGQYGAPPPGQYGAPPPGQYGAPPPNQYGAPPPQQQGWSTHSPVPPAGYPPPQQPGYGAPPPQPYGAPPATPPSLGYGPMQTAHIDVSHEVTAVRKAMQGFGTNEKALIAHLSKKDPLQIDALRTQYDQRLMRSLIADLRSETSGYFQKGLVQLASGPLLADCIVLKDAMKGLGTREAAIDDVLVGRSNADIHAIKAAYQQMHRTSLENDLRSDLSAGTQQMYMMIVAARRAEEAAAVIPPQVDSDVTALHSAMGNIVSKNSTQVCELLLTKNDAQLRAIAQAYQARFHKSLDAVLASKFSGHMEDVLRLLVARAVDRPLAEARRLEEAMAGLGTKDELLVARVVRCHWDQNFMRQVAGAYQAKVKTGTTLVKRIQGETSGDYQRLMVACVQ